MNDDTVNNFSVLSMRIVVLGYIIRGPIGGLAWHHLQYVLGLRRLGHDVMFIEDSDDYPACYDPSRHVVDTDPTYGLAFASNAFAEIEMSDAWAYHDAHTGRWLGEGAAVAEEFCRSADIVLNVSSVNPLRDWLMEAPVRALIDTDPAFTQVRHLKDPAARDRALEHNRFFTFAENVARGTASLPNDGFQWTATRQPVVMDLWTVDAAPAAASYTTVMQWQSYAPVAYEGQLYGTKAESFGPYADLPRRIELPMEIALGGNDAPREMLIENGWNLQNPLDVARGPGDFQNYVRGSRGEFTVAKHAYVVSNSGWFSERSAAYLASGKPVVTQETGFSEFLPTGSGLFGFRDEREAIEALQEIERDYKANARAARKIAEDCFDARDVLTQLLDLL